MNFEFKCVVISYDKHNLLLKIHSVCSG